jgi:hypothetical protein
MLTIIARAVDVVALVTAADAEELVADVVEVPTVAALEISKARSRPSHRVT